MQTFHKFKLSTGFASLLLCACCWCGALFADNAVIDVTSRGIVADGKTCQANALSKLVETVGDGSTLYFPAGVYYWSRPIPVKGKKNITFKGTAGTVIKLHFSPWGAVSECNAGFVAERCAGLTFEQFTFTTDNPSSCAGRVVAKHPETGYFDVAIDPQFPITGWEHFWGIDTCDEAGMPDYAIETYEKVTSAEVPDGKGGKRVKWTGRPYEVIAPQLIRVLAPGGKQFDFNRLHDNHRILFRYIIYGNTVFSVNGCSDVVWRDIEIERCASMGAVVAPPSKNLTFERFNMRSPKGSAALYCANADGIHILGLTGFLKMHDCHFDGLGDDALNIHGKAGEVKTWNPETGAMTCICRDTSRRETSLPWGWAQAGDKLVVYAGKTFLTKGLVSVRSYQNGKAQIDAGSVKIEVGDVLANDKDFATVEITNCSVRNTRARGFLLQSRNMTIADCTFEGLALPGLLIAPDVRVWNEVGPTINTEIRGCTFRKCAMNGSRANLGAIAVKPSHDAGIDDEHPAGVHQDVRIIGNTFETCGNSAVFLASTEGVVVKGNTFKNITARPYHNPDEGINYAVRLHNCTKIQVESNTLDKGKEWLVTDK